MESTEFHSLPLTPIDADGLIGWLLNRRKPAAAAYLNAHTANLCWRTGSVLRPLLSSMDLVHADGMSVVREARREGIEMPGRVSAADFFERFSWAAAARGKSIALVGGAGETAAKCAEQIASQVPGLRICFHRDGYFAQDSAAESEVRRLLLEARPGVTLLGMGSPRQEALALKLRDEDRLGVVWCVGALFEYFAPGTRRHAPLWMRENGLEWAFRLSQEPHRLAKRYLLGNVEFMLRTRGILRTR